MFALLTVACKGGDKLQEKLDLGQKYLAEADYENALLAFEEAIEIDDKSVQAYIGAADAYIGLGVPDEALEILQKGIEMTGDPELEAKKQEIQEIIALSSYDVEQILVSDNVFFITDWLNRKGLDHYVFGENPNKTGLYLTESYGLMIYRGEYDGDKRSGNGTWVGAGYVAKGAWSDDKPNGHQSVTATDLNDSKEGIVVDGLWNGTISTKTYDGTVYSINYTNGIVKVLDTYKSGSETTYVVAYTGNSDYGIGEIGGTYGIRGFSDYWF